jgi:hypothetical protein
MTGQTSLIERDGIKINVKRPYAASWYDHVQDWVEKLPVPYWVFYPAAGLLLFGIETLIQWNDGTYAVGSFYLFHLVYCCLVPYIFALGHYLHDTAASALEEFQPVMEVSPEELSQLHYQLMTIPARPFLLWNVFGLIFAIVSITFMPLPLQLQMFNVSGSALSQTSNHILWMGFSTMGFAGIYALFHQLRLTDHIYTTYARVKMFKLTPLYGFARLGAAGAFGVLIMLYAIYATASEAYQTNIPGQATLIANIPAIIILFVGPLLGIHRLLVQEKGQQLNKNAELLEATITELHQRIANKDMTHMDELNHALTSLEIERKLLEGTSTWPWSPATFRGMVVALVLPTALWLLQRLLERVMTP